MQRFAFGVSEVMSAVLRNWLSGRPNNSEEGYDDDCTVIVVTPLPSCWEATAKATGRECEGRRSEDGEGGGGGETGRREDEEVKDDEEKDEEQGGGAGGEEEDAEENEEGERERHRWRRRRRRRREDTGRKTLNCWAREAATSPGRPQRAPLVLSKTLNY